MDKLSISELESITPSAVEANMERFKSLFPDAFFEGEVNFSVLRQLLGVSDDESSERYGLTWSGKNRSRGLALSPGTGTLRPCQDESIDWETTRNLLIEGDNLEVLKLLRRSYSHKVKLIYIDPPYNTGKDFIYQDNFVDGIENYLRFTGQVDDKGYKRSSNVERSGRFHTNWLNMMYPRLKVAHSLLADDGLLIASISDVELHNLRSCLDEIFGVDNMIGCVVWNSTKSVTNTALISVSHTYNVIYARHRDYFVENRSHFRLVDDGEGFSNPDDDPRGPWKADPFQVGGERPNQMYPIENPKTGKVYKPNPGNSWKNELEVFERLMAEGRIVFGKKGESGPQRKRFQSEAEKRGKVAKTWWDDIDTTTNATNASKRLMGESVFDNPKPASLIQRFVQLGVHDPEGAIVMDFFAGSGTTAQAVIEQNIIDSGKRRYILVELPFPLDPNKKEQKIAADYCDKIGRPRTLSELTKEQLLRFGKKIQKKSPDASIDIGFRVFKLDDSNEKPWEQSPENLEKALEDYVENIKEDRTEQDLLYGLLLKYGFDLCSEIETKILAGKRVECVGRGALIVCLASKIKKLEVEILASGIADWREEMNSSKDTTVIFRDNAFDDDIVKTNCSEILRNCRHIREVRSI